MKTEDVIQELRATVDDVVERSNTYPADAHLEMMELVSGCALQLGLILQNIHEAWNAKNYPGTRQLCSERDQPTGRCEDDTLSINDDEPLCEECYDMALGSNKTHE